jgi:hypothetical protein
MHAVATTGYRLPQGIDRFLVYIYRFDIMPQPNPRFPTAKGLFPEPATSLFRLTKARRNDLTLLGGVVALEQLRSLVDLVPCFGEKANTRLTKESSLECSSEFWLNKYFTKEFFYALDQ